VITPPIGLLDFSRAFRRRLNSAPERALSCPNRANHDWVSTGEAMGPSDQFAISAAEIMPD